LVILLPFSGCRIHDPYHHNEIKIKGYREMALIFKRGKRVVLAKNSNLFEIKASILNRKIGISG
jgi:hypothetical protein